MGSASPEERSDDLPHVPEEAFARFAAFLDRHPEASQEQFEAECDAHPALAANLRAIRADYLALEGQFPGPIEATVSAALPPAAIRLWGHLLTTGHRGDRYKELGELGRGAMGVVLEVWDDELLRPLAMKVMRDAAVASDERRRRFLQEAQVTSQLDHPGIVPVHEIGLRSGNAAYYTMRRVRGDELREVLTWVASGHGGWSRARAIDVLLKVCDAMRYAHAKGVVHRDLKPANIMVGDYGEVYVMDWGLARVLGSGTETAPGLVDTDRSQSPTPPQSPLTTTDGAVLGTPSYMSPEQAAGRVYLVDQRTDIYSLGAILYHLLCGHAPFVSAVADHDSTSVLDRLSKGPPPAIRDVAANCPRDLAAICEKAMARELSARYQSVDDLAADLRAFAEGRVVRAFEMGPIAELRKWVRRNKALAMAGVVASFVAIVSILLGFQLARHRMAERQRLAVDHLLIELDALADVRVGHPGDGASGAAGAWLARTRALVDGDAGEGTGLAHYSGLLAELESGSSGNVDTVTAPLRDGWSLGDLLEAKRMELSWRRRMRNSESWPSDAEVDGQVRDLGVRAGMKELGNQAWDLINPDRSRRFFGYERCAERLARLAADEAKGALDRLQTYDTLAFSLCRMGKFDEALARQDLAIQAAREYCEMREPVSHAEPEKWLADLKENRSIMLRLAATERDEGERRLAVLEGEIARLEHESSSRRKTFGAAFDDWWHKRILEVETRLERLKRRVEMTEHSLLSDDGRRAWQKAIDAIVQDDRYGRLRITPQVDLFPLGADGDSGLQEFAHLPSGFIARRDSERRLIVTENTGLVLVLVPGAGDSLPFFLSKFEINQAQWSRLDGYWPVAQRDTATVLAERYLSWNNCDSRLRAAGSGLRLPTKDEWLRACHAGRPEGWYNKVPLAAILQPDYPGSTENRLGNPYGLFDMLGGMKEWVSGTGTNPWAIEQPRWLMALSEESDGKRVFGTLHEGRQASADNGLRPARSLNP